MHEILVGLSVVFQPSNLIGCFVGVAIGQVIDVLPGLGPVGALSLLLPATFYIDPITAIIILSGIYYGAQYGGTITSILLNIPGEPPLLWYAPTATRRPSKDGRDPH